MKLTSNQDGDTIVEVTIAMAILTAVLISAFVLANRAFAIGQVARERSQLIGLLQQQAEAITSFRNSTNWPEFTNGNANYSGVASLAGTSCFHMEVKVINSIKRWVPVNGAVPSGGVSVPTANICINGALIALGTYKFGITYTANGYAGTQDYAQDIELELTSLDSLRGIL